MRSKKKTVGVIKLIVKLLDGHCTEPEPDASAHDPKKPMQGKMAGYAHSQPDTHRVQMMPLYCGVLVRSSLEIIAVRLGIME